MGKAKPTPGVLDTVPTIEESNPPPSINPQSQQYAINPKRVPRIVGFTPAEAVDCLRRTFLESAVWGTDHFEQLSEDDRHICLDKGYDYESVRTTVAEYGYTAHIKARGV